jgi:four helix bundle protein
MGVYRFEDLEVWKAAREFCREIGAAIHTPHFETESVLRERLNKTALSIIENIAEGFERESRKEFAQFTRIAKGSNGEARTLLYVAYDRGCLEESSFTRLIERNTSIAKMLRSLYQALSAPRPDSTGMKEG